MVEPWVNTTTKWLNLICLVMLLVVGTLELIWGLLLVLGLGIFLWFGLFWMVWWQLVGGAVVLALGIWFAIGIYPDIREGLNTKRRTNIYKHRVKVLIIGIVATVLAWTWYYSFWMIVPFAVLFYLIMVYYKPTA